jgi:hypothetical protein
MHIDALPDTPESKSPVGQRIRVPRKATGLALSRFVYNRKAALFAHLGRPPTTIERLLIERTIQIEWALRLIDFKLRIDLPVNELRALLRTVPSLESQYRQNLTALGWHSAPQNGGAHGLPCRFVENDLLHRDAPARRLGAGHSLGVEPRVKVARHPQKHRDGCRLSGPL